MFRVLLSDARSICEMRNRPRENHDLALPLRAVLLAVDDLRDGGNAVTELLICSRQFDLDMPRAQRWARRWIASCFR